MSLSTCEGGPVPLRVRARGAWAEEARGGGARERAGAAQRVPKKWWGVEKYRGGSHQPRRSACLAAYR